jgi:hypothetical protein
LHAAENNLITSSILMFSDVLAKALLAVDHVISGELDRSAQGPLVEDIKALLGEFEDVLITHVRRSCNEVAHRLAKAGCRNKLVNPGWVLPLVL